MSKNDNKQPPTGKRILNDDVKGGYNPTTSEQRPKPPAKPPERPKTDK